ncbi:MAG: hypothetical protein Q9Q40_12445, partial [Acidobacteriota bacterium]|nr:hypothetical protein [Acidobacteriota bacterium]
ALGKVLGACGTREEARERLEEAFRLARTHGLIEKAREAGQHLETLAAEWGDSAERRRWRSRLKRLSGPNLGTLMSAMGWDVRPKERRRTP